MKIVFTTQEFKTVAIEIWRASWGIAAFSAIMAHQMPDSSTLFYLSGAVGWLMMQVIAAVVDAIKGDDYDAS